MPLVRNGLVVFWVLLVSAARLVRLNGVAPLSEPSPIAVPWLMVTALTVVLEPSVVVRIWGPAPLLELLPEEEELLELEELEPLPEELLLELEELELLLPELDELLEEELPELELPLPLELEDEPLLEEEEVVSVVL